MEQEIQSKVIEFSMVEEENKRLEQQLHLVEQQMASFEALKEYLSEIAKQKGEFLASLGSGVFLKSELKDNKRVLINVGSGVVVEKSIDDAQGIIERQERRIQEIRQEIEQMVGKNFEMMIRLEREIRKLATRGEGE